MIMYTYRKVITKIIVLLDSLTRLTTFIGLSSYVLIIKYVV